MKKNIILLAGLLVALTSCYKSKLDPLSGTFPTPTKVEATTVTASAEKLQSSYHLFTVDLVNGSNTVHLALVAEKYYLTTNTYTGAELDAAKKGNFILGSTTVNSIEVTSGKVVVEQTALSETENIYTITAVLFMESGNPFTLEWTGALSFYPDPVVGDIVVENSLTDVVSTTEVGTTKHAVTLLDADDEIAAYFEFYTPASAESIAGSYNCIEYAESNADGWVVGNGWSFPDWGISGGSYYVQDGTHVDVQPGSVIRVAALSENSYAISVDDSYLIVGGQMGEAIVVPGAITVETTGTEVGTNKNALTIVDEENATSAYFELFTPGNAATFAGSFACIEYAETNADGYVVSNGWSFPDWGIAGGSHYTVNEVQTDLAVGSTVNVVIIGEKMYSIAVPGAYSVLAKVK